MKTTENPVAIGAGYSLSLDVSTYNKLRVGSSACYVVDLTSAPGFQAEVRTAIVAQRRGVVACVTFTPATTHQRPDPRSMIDRHDGAAPTPFGLRREFDFIEIDNVDLRHRSRVL